MIANKRKPGRPHSGIETKVISARLPVDLVAFVHQRAREAGQTVTEQLRRLIERAKKES